MVEYWTGGLAANHQRHQVPYAILFINCNIILILTLTKKHLITVILYCIAGIYYKSFNFANLANWKALAKIKTSIYFWICIAQTKCIASN